MNTQQAPDGSYRVRIRSASTRKWYSEGEAFESYEVLSIDPDTGCVVIFVEQMGRRVEVCMETVSNEEFERLKRLGYIQ